MNKPSKDGGTATNNNNDKNKAEVNGLFLAKDMDIY